jgi:hypothetical protein
MLNAYNPLAISDHLCEDGQGFCPYLVEEYLSAEILAVMAPENLVLAFLSVTVHPRRYCQR